MSTTRRPRRGSGSSQRQLDPELWRAVSGWLELDWPFEQGVRPAKWMRTVRGQPPDFGLFLLPSRMSDYDIMSLLLQSR